MNIHLLKLNEIYANDVYNLVKRFEIRKNDRDYQVGDIIRFTVVNSGVIIEHPINYVDFVITYKFDDFGLKNDYVILGIDKYYVL